MGMVAGAPFPDLYDWTWGEVVEYIDCYDERRKENLRIEASMLFDTAGALAKMVAGQRGTKITIMDTYSFLWSEEERQKAKADKRHASLTRKAKPKQKPMTLDEQSDMLHELKMKMQAETE